MLKMVRPLHRYAVGIALMVAVSGIVFAGGGRERSDDEAPAAGQETRIAVGDAVARVNGELLARDEFDTLVADTVTRYEAQGGQSLTDEQRQLVQRQVLDTMITRAVLEQEIAQRGIAVDEEAVDAALQQFKSQFPSETAYTLALEEQGLTEGEFLPELRFQLDVEELLQTVVYEGLVVDEAEMTSFYTENPQFFTRDEQVAARHIIFTTEGDEDDEARATMRTALEALREEIIAGADFAEVAREHSQGPSAPNGGDLGTFGRGQMVPEFEAAAFALEEGAISEVIETSFGYHIVQVTQRIPAETLSYEDAAENIRAYLTQDKRNTEAQGYVDGLRTSAEVEELITIEG